MTDFSSWEVVVGLILAIIIVYWLVRMSMDPGFMLWIQRPRRHCGLPRCPSTIDLNGYMTYLENGGEDIYGILKRPGVKREESQNVQTEKAVCASSFNLNDTDIPYIDESSKQSDSNIL